jgi:hypothetical protein
MTTKNSQAIAPVLASIAKYSDRLNVAHHRPQLRTYMFNDLQQGIANFLECEQGLAKFIEIYGQKTADDYIAAIQAMSGVEEVMQANWNVMQKEGMQTLQTFVEQYFPKGEPIEVFLPGLSTTIEIQRVVSLSAPNPWGGGTPTVIYDEARDHISFNMIFQDQGDSYWSGSVGINGAGVWTCSLQNPIPNDHPAVVQAIHG